jgi:hypothetical protein
LLAAIEADRQNQQQQQQQQSIKESLTISSDGVTATAPSTNTTIDNDQSNSTNIKDTHNDSSNSNGNSNSIDDTHIHSSDDPICPACLGLLQNPTTSVAQRAHQVIKDTGYLNPQTFIVSIHVPSQLATRARSIHLCIQHELKKEGIEYVPPLYTTKPSFRPKEWRGESSNSKDAEDSNDQNSNNNNKAGETSNSPPQPPGSPTEIINPQNGSNGEAFLLADPHDLVEVKEVLKTVVSRSLTEETGMRYHPEASLSLELGFDHLETDGEFTFMAGLPKAQYKFKKKRKRVCVWSLGIQHMWSLSKGCLCLFL